MHHPTPQNTDHLVDAEVVGSTVDDAPTTTADTVGAPSMVTVVAVHGNGGGGFRFSLLPELLAPNVALRAVTLPGFGGRPLPSKPFSLTMLTDALADELETIPGRRVLLGHGIGGSIALQLLGDRADLADALILHAPVGAHLDTRLFPKVMARPAVRAAVQRIIAAAPTRLVASRLLFRSAPQGFADRFLAEYGRCAAFGAMFDALTADWFDALEPVGLPAAIVWGERDRVLDVGHVAAFEALLPASRRIVVDGWGHFPMIDEPGAYAATIGTLVRELVEAPG